MERMFSKAKQALFRGRQAHSVRADVGRTLTSTTYLPGGRVRRPPIHEYVLRGLLTWVE